MVGTLALDGYRPTWTMALHLVHRGADFSVPNLTINPFIRGLSTNHRLHFVPLYLRMCLLA